MDYSDASRASMMGQGSSVTPFVRTPRPVQPVPTTAPYAYDQAFLDSPEMAGYGTNALGSRAAPNAMKAQQYRAARVGTNQADYAGMSNLNPLKFASGGGNGWRSGPAVANKEAELEAIRNPQPDYLVQALRTKSLNPEGIRRNANTFKGTTNAPVAPEGKTNPSGANRSAQVTSQV